MTIELLHWEVRNEINKLQNNHKKYLTDIEVDSAINKGINDYINLFYYGHTDIAPIEGFEENRQRLDMFDTLIGCVTETSNTDDYCGYKRNKIDFNRLDFKSLISASVCSKCGITKVTEVAWNELDANLQDYHRQPSNRFKRILGTFKQDILYIYSESALTDVNITYLKKPNEVCIGTYPDLSNKDNDPTNLKEKVECNLPDCFHYLVIKLAVRNLQRIYEQNSIQLTSNAIERLT